MAQIAAEELGLPLDQRARSSSATRRAGRSRRSRPARRPRPSMGPAVRAAAADAKRQLIEIAAQRYHLEERVLDIKDGQVISADGGSWPLEEVTGLLEDAQILGKGARGPNPTGMRVLTFGVQVAEVAVDVETGEVRVERIAAIHDVGRDHQPAGRVRARSRAGSSRGSDTRSRRSGCSTPQTRHDARRQTLDAYKLPTIADVPEIVCEFVDKPDEHLTNLGSKGLGEPPIIPTAAAIANAIRDATGADIHSLPITREEMLRALREARRAAASAGASWSCSGLSPPRPRRRRSATAPWRSRAGRSSYRCSATASSQADTLVDASRRRPARGRRNARSARARRWPSSRPIRRSRRRLREALLARGFAPAAVDEHARRQPAAGDAVLVLAAQVSLLSARRRQLPRRGRASTVSTRSSATTRCASAHPSDPAAALLALGARLRTTTPRASARRPLSPADRRRPQRDRARAGRADPRARRATTRRRAST